MEPIKLTDGTELLPLEPEEKTKLEAEIREILEKYGATYLPIIKEEHTLSSQIQTATLLLMKIQKEIKSPFIENGGENNKTEETPKID